MIIRVLVGIFCSNYIVLQLKRSPESGPVDGGGADLQGVRTWHGAAFSTCSGPARSTGPL